MRSSFLNYGVYRVLSSQFRTPKYSLSLKCKLKSKVKHTHKNLNYTLWLMVMPCFPKTTITELYFKSIKWQLSVMLLSDICKLRPVLCNQWGPSPVSLHNLPKKKKKKGSAAFQGWSLNLSTLLFNPGTLVFFFSLINK